MEVKPSKPPQSFAPALVEQVADRDLGPGLGHQSGRRGANAPRRTRDQSHLAIETVHSPFLPCAALGQSWL